MTLEELIRQQTDWLKTLSAAAAGKAAPSHADVDALHADAAQARLEVLTRGREAMLARIDGTLARERVVLERAGRAGSVSTDPSKTVAKPK